MDRVSLAERAQDALDAAGIALSMCPVETDCSAAQSKLAAAQAILSQLETYVYRGQ
jgi:hypothetical protein